MDRTTRLIAQTDEFCAHNYEPLPVVLSHGYGPWVFDVEGRRYLDCISAYSSLNAGHLHPRIVATMERQLARLSLTSRAVHNDQLGPFLAQLCSVAGMEQALPMNTGVEAVETAIKLARKWGYQTKGVAHDCAEIVVCRNNFHGRTTTVVGFSSEPQYREGFGPFGAGFRLIDFGDSDALREALDQNTVAFLVEPIQAEAGILTPPQGYLTDAAKLCRDRNVLFMLDEIQTGLGRTGRMFAFEHEQDARPDVLLLGKALGGGLYPVSAALTSRQIMQVIGPGEHGSTFGGNPLASAVANAAVQVIIDENLPARASALGARLLAGLHALDSDKVADVRGSGLLIGIELTEAAGSARTFALELLKDGVLCKETHRQVLRLAPPLIVDEADIDWLLERIARVLS